MRYKIATADTYLEAVDLKEDLKEKFPNKIFQIRNKNGKFTIIERVTKVNKETKRGDSF